MGVLGTPPTLRTVARLACACALCCAALVAAGCGGASAGASHRTGTAVAKVTAGATGTTSATGTGTDPAPAGQTKATGAAARKRAAVAHVDVVSDKVLAEGKVHIASGAPSDAEVKKEIESARKHGAKLPAGESVAAFEAAAAQTAEPAPDAITPLAPWNPRDKPIASWIVPVLEWAAEHGWQGTVTSGYRTYFEQAQLNHAGAFSAPAGFSNHESTVYPGGAVDVTNSGQLIQVLKAYAGPRKLVGGVLGPVDPEHFSATGV